MNTIEIPKRLFFIWFGNQIPDFVRFSIENYKIINKNFKIVFIQRNIKQLEDIILRNNIQNEYDVDIKKSWDILHDEKSVYNQYVIHQKNVYGDTIRVIQILSDILRVVLINEHGGIYVDCDTFPMNPMDDLIKKESFVVQRYYQNGKLWFDNYFMGSNGKDKIFDPINDPNRTNGLIQTDKKWFNDPNYISNKVNFFKSNKNNIKYNKKYYIEHYYRSDWKNNNSSINMILNNLDYFCK